MNSELRALVDAVGLNTQEMEKTRLDFCFACAESISHLLELDEALSAYQSFKSYLNGQLGNGEFENLKKSIWSTANSHQGSKSLDGTKHSAVSATYALANAINGNAVAAAEYAAYSKTYGYGGYSVSDLESYQDEYSAQVSILKELLAKKQSHEFNIVRPDRLRPKPPSEVAPKDNALLVLAKWVQAFNSSDIDGIVSLYAPDALFIGTGSKEVGTNPEYFRTYFQSLKRDMPRGAKLESYSALELSSTVVLISGMDSVSGNKDGVLFHRPGRVSFVIVKRDDKWQIIQFHRSAMPQ